MARERKPSAIVGSCSGLAKMACCISKKSWKIVSSSSVTAGETPRPGMLRFSSSFSRRSGVIS